MVMALATYEIQRRKCIHCGKELLKEHMTLTRNSDWACKECIKELYTKCEGQCEYYELDEFMKDYGNGMQCKECRETNGNQYE